MAEAAQNLEERVSDPQAQQIQQAQAAQRAANDDNYHQDISPAQKTEHVAFNRDRNYVAVGAGVLGGAALMGAYGLPALGYSSVAAYGGLAAFAVAAPVAALAWFGLAGIFGGYTSKALFGT